jgi:hypothetical protein
MEKKRRIVQLKKRPDMSEVIQLCLEALVKWEAGSSPEDLNMALSELRDADIAIKSVERSTHSDLVLLFMSDGTSYGVSVSRLDNNLRKG